MLQFPYAGTTQIRFKGCDLRLMKPPLTNVQFTKIIVYRHMCVKHKTIGIQRKAFGIFMYIFLSKPSSLLYKSSE